MGSAMLDIAKILLPVDFQEAAPSVVHQAAALARRFHSQIVLLHVVTPLSYSAGTLDGNYVPVSREDLMAELIRQAENNLERSLQSELHGLAVKRILRKGDPAANIVQTARDENAGLIAMPTHGYGTFRRFLLGSVAAKVLHDSECPVWTGAHLEETQAREFAIGNVACAIDLSPHSRNTISGAARIAKEFSARLTLLHVIAGLHAYAAGGSDAFPEWLEEIETSAAQQIAKLQQELGTKAEVIIASGDVPKLLSETTKKIGADLLVIGRRSGGGHLGGTGYSIIRDSHIPVLSL
jgi:nucleotide-binding universal stress UspA family protein